VCLDLHLPDIDGIEVCRRLRDEATTRLLPVILLTSVEDSEALRASFDAGVTEVLHKSAGLSELHRAITHFVEQLGRRVTGRVLYVEDSPTAAHLTMHVLKQMQIDIVYHERADEALASFEADDFDLVITDVVLEGAMSGLSLVRAIRKLDGEKARVPVLALSAFDDPARRVELLRSGANDYVSKPVLQEELVARVGNLICSKQLFDQVQAQQRELATLAVTDALTGLYNRRYLASASAQQIANALRHRDPLSLVVLDLDHFKRINDEHGHTQGDAVLAEVGKLLSNEARKGDICARIGGEEFVVLLPKCLRHDAIAKAHRLREAIAELRPGGIEVTASLGVATFEADSDASFDDLFKRADGAAYASKRNGRNRVEND
jgi:two-component system cell cycle response regulator